MGGRGSRSGGAPGGTLGGGGVGTLFTAGGIPIPQGPPPNVTPGQPAPPVSIAQLQSMTDTEFANYLNALKSTPIDPNTYFNSDWDTQRLIANMPELNQAPSVVDAKTFASLPGQTMYRTVNAEGQNTAVDICARTMASDVTTIGAGVMGDGFYFSTSMSTSQGIYGKTRGNISKTATMSVKLNQNANVVTSVNLRSMLAKESRAVQSAVDNMRSGNVWGGTHSGLMAYALRKGYNVVSRNDMTFNVIDRTAATWSSNVIPWR